VCVKDPNESLAICERLRAQYPLLAIYARAYDRTHTIALDRVGVELSVRDTFESAIRAGREVLETLGVSPERAAAVEGDVRARDLARLEAQKLAGIEAGLDLLHQKTMRPEPLRAPLHEGRALNEEARAVIEGEGGGEESGRRAAE
jgi:voltage-gated potassium channel Kch